MTTVQSKVTDGQDLIPFFYLRISGLPYYFFASIDPANSAYGAFAWSAPNGYFDATGWHRGGLMLPDDTIEQKFADIIGGIATPGRIRLSIIDFPAPGFPGYGFFSRLFSPGRALTDTSVQKAPLLESITVDSTEISVRDKAATFTADSDIYLGAETIAISSASGPDSDGVSVLTI